MREQGAALSHRRFYRGSFRRDCLPNGAAWRFPDWTAVGLAIPSPFLGSAPLGIPLPEHSRLVGLDLTGIGRLSLRDPQITGGDSNPDCHWRFLTPVLGWPCRWPPTFAVPALPCFARSSLLKSRTQYSEAFSFFAGHFHARRRKPLYKIQQKSREKSRCSDQVIHR